MKDPITHAVVEKTHPWDKGNTIRCLKHLMTPASIAVELVQMAASTGSATATSVYGGVTTVLPEPMIVADWACETAAALWTQFENRGWILDVPMPPEEKPEDHDDQ